MSSWQRKFTTIGPIFAGADVFVVGTGTSLREFDWSRLAGRSTIVLNDAVKHVQDASIHLFSDSGIWKRYKDLVYNNGTRIVCQLAAIQNFLKARPDLHDCIYEFKHYGAPDMSEGPKDIKLYVAQTVATAGIMLAWRLCARRVFLLGVDGYRGVDGSYYCDGSVKRRVRAKKQKVVDGLIVEAHHQKWGDNMRRLKKSFCGIGIYPCNFPGAGVYNLSARSSIDAWPKIDVDKILNGREA